MRIVYQRYSESCGATCLAIIADRPVEDAEGLVGRGRTKAADLAWGLRVLGFKVTSDRLVRVSRMLGHKPRHGDVCRIKWEGIKHGGHWAVKADGGYYDPVFGFVGEEFFSTKQGRRGKVTSFLRVGR